MRMSRALIIVALIVAVVVAWELVRAIRAYRIERMTLFPPRGPVAAPPDSAALGLIDVEFRSRDSVTLRGWYLPSRNGAAIILVHGSGSDRSSVLPELRLLGEDGFGILAFDLPGHGASDGDVHFGLPPVKAVEGAVDFLVERRDIHDGQIGVAGFSYGGAIVARAAAQDCRMRVVALVSTPADAITQTQAEYAPYGRAAQFGAFAVYQVRGINLESERPVDYVGKIAPRPLLIVGGAEDATVPLSETRRLYAAAGDPKQFVLIPHGTHGQFAEVDSSYANTLANFFNSNLHGPPASATDCLR